MSIYSHMDHYQRQVGNETMYSLLEVYHQLHPVNDTNNAGEVLR